MLSAGLATAPMSPAPLSRPITDPKGNTNEPIKGRSAAVAVSSSTKAPTSSASLGRKRTAYLLKASPPICQGVEEAEEEDEDNNEEEEYKDNDKEEEYKDNRDDDEDNDEEI
ncbi:hypothetical protein V496_01115 [Pseudogymnoascus sp. VKM F-4515 (FW-2607)]|nr:hypothetical protein V496_01115 [Pseudogymnoascus sp. VKM F-4515 (FW-2607)]